MSLQYNNTGAAVIKAEQDGSDQSFAQIVELAGPGPSFHVLAVDSSGQIGINNFPATQPVSGTITANAGSGTFTVGGTVTANAGTGTFTVSGTITTNADTTIGGTTAPAKLLLLGGKSSDATPQYQPLPMTAAGAAIKIDGTATTQPISGTVTANAGSGTFTVGGTVTANAGTGTFTSAGDVASGSADSGNPLKLGGKASTGVPAATSSANRINAYFDGVGRLASFPGSSWSVFNQPAAATQATISRAAAGSGIKNVCTSLNFEVITLGTAPTAANVVVNLRDGATGAGTVLRTFQVRVPAAVNNTIAISLAGLWIEGSANTAMTLETSAAPGSNIQASVSMTGTTTA